MKKKVSVFNFTNVYEKQSFYQFDKSSICVSDSTIPDAKKVDLTGISGTNCMCDDAAMDAIRKAISDNNIGADEIHFIDNGNYHYMSAIMLEQIIEPISLVVFDHHPDMQPPMFGDILSCGGWVLYALEHNPNIKDIHIIGADEKLISELPEDVRSRALFYSVSDVIRKADSDSEEACVVNLPSTQYPVYLSIDKDVLSAEEITTNWDQGEMTRNQLFCLIKELLTCREVIGVDICGECALDQEGINVDEAVAENDKLNKELLGILLNS
ncbi:arginase family protein [Butyrivibrio sp. VCB2006]|uniref:arginase family protein n=1 Tax=Butyrivibrio sp. VCB2006 TaxID=1280679 RepID=UPI000409642C|nr:arginase family protein [Butyrivibrio sp. VCB2006]